MIVSGKYERKELIQSGAVCTYRARHQTLGHELMLHFVAAGPEGATLLELLSQLPEPKRQLFIDAGEHESEAYLVSWPLPEFEGLIGWLERAIHAQKKPPAPQPTAAVRTVTDAGEFTRMFRAATPGPPKEPAPPDAGPAKVERPAPQPAEPGEFTMFFADSALPSGPKPGAPEARVPPPSALPPEREAARPKQSDFTALFGSVPGPSLEPAAPPVKPQPQQQPASGGLTEFFRVPVGGEPSPAEPAMPPRQPPPMPAPAPVSYQPPPAPVRDAPRQPMPVSRPPANARLKVLFGSLGLLILLALAIVVFFAFRR